jgi:PAS domain-containing protein
LYGYSSAEMVGQSISLLIPENRSGEMTGILARIRTGEHVDHFETTRLRKDGSVLSVSLSVSPLRDADGAIIGASTVGRELVFSEGMAVDYPLTIRHRNGTLTEVGYNASAQRDTEGNVLGVFAAARDMTRLLQAQREAAEEQTRALERLAELERFQRMTVGRELKMIELKKENESLRRLLQSDEG